MSLRSETRRQEAEWIRARLHDLDMTPPAGGRFDQMLLAAEHPPQGEQVELLPVLLRAEKDVQELRVILETFSCAPLRDDINELLRCVVGKDPLHPESKTNSPGRDAQFELFIAAMLTRAHMNPIRPKGDGLADFIVTMKNGRSYAVEAKRIKGSGFDGTFAHACQQIDKTGLTGFVFVDCGPFLHQGNDFIDVPMSETDFCSSNLEQLRHFFHSRLQKLRQIRKGRPVRSIQAVNWLVRECTQRGWGLDTLYYGVPLDEHHPKRKLEHLVFQEHFNLAIPGSTQRIDQVSRAIHTLVKSGADFGSLLPRVE